MSNEAATKPTTLRDKINLGGKIVLPGLFAVAAGDGVKDWLEGQKELGIAKLFAGIFGALVSDWEPPKKNLPLTAKTLVLWSGMSFAAYLTFDGIKSHVAEGEREILALPVISPETNVQLKDIFCGDSKKVSKPFSVVINGEKYRLTCPAPVAASGPQ